MGKGDENEKANCELCQAHTLMETVISENRKDVAGLRDMFVQFMQHAAGEHERIRDEILLLAKTVHTNEGRQQTLGEDQPHPLRRGEDYEEKIALTLSRKDFWRLIGLGTVIIFLLVGVALVAGRDGLSIWSTVGSKAVNVVKP